ncbi:hypothetical protein M2103_000527 [Ereboglobus sp. PH5-5]|uniref:hypothetical protein n=1 Tax=Ereboglobus sp. PH5-5 TaxID=2940529 RepID=UPI0024057341|nr:hypothetical protein [Ereboglobus sp. PH5-5]MDF9832317.1 hypothetical protein [Ereboglobus sp. PH5-5]
MRTQPLHSTAIAGATSAAKEINRLHAEAQRLAAESRHSLDGALASAWHAGCLLNEEKKRVRRSAGHGAWIPWLKHFFLGSMSTAHRYMRLARGTGDIALLRGISLRQAYARLGIATEPKHHALDEKHPLPKPPAHVLLASKLIRFLRHQNNQHAARGATDCIRDLAPLYAQLRPLFENTVSNGNCSIRSAK